MQEIIDEINSEVVTGRPPRWVLLMLAAAVVIATICAIL